MTFYSSLSLSLFFLRHCLVNFEGWTFPRNSIGGHSSRPTLMGYKKGGRLCFSAVSVWRWTTFGNSPTEREKKNPTNGSVAPSNPDCRVVHHDGEKPHLQRGRGVDSARPPLTPGHFDKSDIEINYRLGSDFRPITAPVA